MIKGTEETILKDAQIGLSNSLPNINARSYLNVKQPLTVTNYIINTLISFTRKHYQVIKTP